ncbi:UNVERIFIED_CONTAM: iron siderophore ABC transporter substrate-binding protein, partial [Mumia flava]
AGQDRRGRGHSEPVSLENLAEIDADYMFFGTLGGSSVNNPQAGGGTDVAASQAALADALEAPGFTRLTAYESGHVIPVDGSAWTSTGGPLLMTRIVTDVEEALVG